MHALGKNVVNKKPKCIRYPHHKIPAVIPEPVKMDGARAVMKPVLRPSKHQNLNKITTHV